MDRVSAALNWSWSAMGSGDLSTTVGPEDVLHYIYALFFSASYRHDFAAALQTDFPRIPVTHKRDLFRSLCGAGKRLVELHLFDAAAPLGTTIEYHGLPPTQLASSFPRFSGSQIQLSETCRLREVTSAAWEFRVGGYQVCRKWLRDRRHRKLTAEDFTHYRRLVWSVGQTIEVANEIDGAIASAGGWHAF